MLQTSRPVTPAALANAGKATWTTDEFDGLSIHCLQLVLGGTAFTKAMITNIQLKIGGKVVIDSLTGTQLDQMNFWETNIQDGATYLHINFGSPSASNYYGKHSGDLDLSVIKGPKGTKANLELNITYAGATAPTLKVNVDVELPKSTNKNFGGGEGALVGLFQHTGLTPANAQNKAAQIINFAQYAKSGIISTFWFHTGHMDSLQVYKDSAVLWDDISVADMNGYNARYNHPAINNVYVWSPTLQHAIGKFEKSQKGAHTPSGAINTAPEALANFKWLLTTDAADTIDVVIKSLVPFSEI
jgi:hypothetical protein